MFSVTFTAKCNVRAMYGKTKPNTGRGALGRARGNQWVCLYWMVLLVAPDRTRPASHMKADEPRSTISELSPPSRSSSSPK
jgi:hypothetical protein